jgi:hypothetical protein
MDKVQRARFELEKAVKERLAALHRDEQLRRDVERAYEEVQRGDRGTPLEELRDKLKQ